MKDAVYNEQLKQHLIKGNIGHIFDVLMQLADGNTESDSE